MVKFPDGTVRVLVEGLWRIRVKKFEQPEPYLRASYELLRDDTEDSVELQAMLRNAHKQFEEITKLSTALTDQVKIAALNTEHPGHFADLIAANLNLSLEERQKLLETVSVRERLQKLLPLLNREQEVLNLSSKIQNDVASNIAKTQRDFFLREQMRAIQRELGEGDPNAGEAKSIRERVALAVLPAEVRKAAEQELDRLAQMSPAAAEYAVSRNYLDWILTLPWEKIHGGQAGPQGGAKSPERRAFWPDESQGPAAGISSCSQTPQGNQRPDPLPGRAARRGQDVARQKAWPTRSDANLHASRSAACGYEAEIRGHRRTYVGAMPGRIIQTLRRVESRNPVILLDELDKVGADFRGDRRPRCLKFLTRRKIIRSRTITWICRLICRACFLSQRPTGSSRFIPRCETGSKSLNCRGYTESEKLEIARRYLVPRQLEEHGLTRSDVKFTDAALRQLIRNYTREAGVRQLEREIAALARKATRKIVSRNGAAATMKLDAKDLEKYLGHAKFIFESAEKIGEIGIATGLAWTPVGGDVLFIEATRCAGAVA